MPPREPGPVPQPRQREGAAALREDVCGHDPIPLHSKKPPHSWTGTVSSNFSEKL